MRSFDRRWLALPAALLAALVALAAPLLAPYDPARQFDPAVGRHLPPGTRRHLVYRTDGRQLLAERVTWRDGKAHILHGGRIEKVPADALLPSTGRVRRHVFLLGTDRLGRDCWSRLLWATRLSMLIAVLAVTAAGAIGISAGAIAAMAGGLIDTALMRTADLALSMPKLFLLLAWTAFFDSGPAAMILLIGATAWMPVARIVRSGILTARQENFVVVATSIGCSPTTILLRHLLPPALVPAAVSLLLGVGDVVLLESALSFLGLGVSPPTPTWGGMIADGAADLGEAWWVATFPGIALVGTVVSVNLTADLLLGGPARRRAQGSRRPRTARL